MEFARFQPLDFGAIYRDLASIDGHPDRPYAVIHMISSVDGKATVGGRTSPLGTRIDRAVLKHVRANCDAVGYGAGTLRAENVDPLAPQDMLEWRRDHSMPEHPLRVVFSNSGDVPFQNRFFQSPGAAPIIFIAERVGPARLVELQQKGTVFVAGKDAVDLRAALRILRRDLGIRSISVEGGPRLNHSLFRAALVDELLLTLAPKVVGGHHVPTIVEGPQFDAHDMPALDLASVYREDGELFLRYRVRHA